LQPSEFWVTFKLFPRVWLKSSGRSASTKRKPPFSSVVVVTDFPYPSVIFTVAPGSTAPAAPEIIIPPVPIVPLLAVILEPSGSEQFGGTTGGAVYPTLDKYKKRIYKYFAEFIKYRHFFSI